MSLRVLVIDPSTPIRKAVARTLLGAGYEMATEAADGDEAVRLFALRPYDIVLADWNTRGRGGIDLIRALRDLDPEVPIVMITAETTRKNVQAAIDAGVTDYLAKPFTHENLLAKLARIAPLETR